MTSSTCVVIFSLLYCFLELRAQWKCSSWRPLSTSLGFVALVGGWLAGIFLSCVCVLQVMDPDVKTRFADQMTVYLRSTADGGNQARLDTVLIAEHGMSLRLKHASRRLRAPHIHPGYVTTWAWYLCRVGMCGALSVNAAVYY